MHTKHYHHHPLPHPSEELRLEAVTVSIGFDDLLDVTLAANHPHLDTMIVVTSHEDKRTQAVAQKYGAVCVQSDLYRKNGRQFNKGAMINIGMGHFQWMGWRLHLDADIALPDNFRRMLFNHTHLDQSCIYGADRVDMVWDKDKLKPVPQHQHRCLVEAQLQKPIGARWVHTLHGYAPMGFFQLWHSSCQKSYPYSLGTSEHDDILFAAQWPVSHRHNLPTAIVYHVVPTPPKWSENWEGRTSQRIYPKNRTISE